jgi:hypothetical protein
VHLARTLERFPAVRMAFAGGEISRGHVQAIVNAATTERADAIGAVETELVEVARHASARDLATVMRGLADAIDGDGGARNDAQQWERRRLSVSALLDGMHHVEGVLDGEAATITNAALDREMARAHMPGDGRTRTQRRADAWTAICRRDLARDTTSPYLRLLPHANIVVDLTGVPTDLADLVRHEARTLHQLSAATRQRLTCDAQITRVITDGPSQVLDVGRRTRLVPTALWDALVARDRHCQGDGCTRGPHDCDAHHRQPWQRGGATHLDNLQLRCRYGCHQQAHTDTHHHARAGPQRE